MADIFVSYSQQDGKEAAHALVQDLANDGYEVWWDEELVAIDNFRQKITAELEAAKAVIVIWSDAAAASDFVCAEAGLAKHRGKLVSTYVQGFARRLPLPFGDLQKVEVSDRNEIRRALRRLSVGTMAEKKPDEQRQQTEEANAWAKIAHSRRIEEFELYLGSYPEGLHRLHAEIRIEALRSSACKILLTSKSPRRKDLLNQIGWREDHEFFMMEVHTPAGHQKPTNLPDAKVYVANNAINKLRDAAVATELLSRGLNALQTAIVGADTAIFCNGKILDKPLEGERRSWSDQDRATGRYKAQEMLRCQSGKSIYIITGLAVQVGGDPNSLMQRIVVTEAKLKPYSTEEIEAYLTACEPYDKAGAFGIQEQGIALFEKIVGSYTNVVGLPLREFVEMLDQLHSRTGLSFPARRSPLSSIRKLPPYKELSAVSIGDINYDIVYDDLEPGFFSTISGPGKKIIGQIHRGAGGTAVQFATGARHAGFKKCSVVGVIGGDKLGKEIEEYLKTHDIKAILRPKSGMNTSVVIILRDVNRNDTSLTVTDARQALPDFVFDRAEKDILEADVFYCSGYCLIDRSRILMAQRMMDLAKRSGHIVILDAVVDMNKNPEFSTYDDLLKNLRGLNRQTFVDVFVSELPELLSWMGKKVDYGVDELRVWKQTEADIVKRLRKEFSLCIFRTSNYAHEIVITPNEVLGPRETDYVMLSNKDKIGYGDKKTAELVYSYLSPRIVLASKSPQRYTLRSQLVSKNKIQICKSACGEEELKDESPHERARRLAKEKAIDVF